MNFFNSDNKKKNKIYVETQDYVKILNTDKYVDYSDLFLVDNECSICLSNLDLIELNKKEDIKYNIFDNLFNLFNIKYLITRKEDLINSNSICILSCKHIFHYKCVLEWIEKEKTCPLCRQELKIIK